MIYGPMKPPILPMEFISATPVAAPASFKKVAGHDAITWSHESSSVRHRVYSIMSTCMSGFYKIVRNVAGRHNIPHQAPIQLRQPAGLQKLVWDGSV